MPLYSRNSQRNSKMPTFGSQKGRLVRETSIDKDVFLIYSQCCTCRNFGKLFFNLANQVNINRLCVAGYLCKQQTLQTKTTQFQTINSWQYSAYKDIFEQWLGWRGRGEGLIGPGACQEYAMVGDTVVVVLYYFLSCRFGENLSIFSLQVLQLSSKTGEAVENRPWDVESFTS